MHYAQTYIKEKIVNEDMEQAVVLSSFLNGSSASDLERCLKNDATNYLYSAFISYAEAIEGIQKGLFSWATVKLYYCAFYSLRSILALDGTCIFYLGTKGYSLYVRQGESPAKANGTTHKLVMSLFKKKYQTSPFVTQQIDMIDAFEWLMKQREIANYKNGRFSEPETPIIYEKCSIGLQRLIAAYIDDEEYIYCFDEEHAMIALPLEIMKSAVSAIHDEQSCRFNHKDILYLKRLLRVNGQPVSTFQGLIEKLR